MVSKSVAVIVLSFVAVFVHQCSGRDKFDAIVEAGLGVEYNPSGPLFMINTVTLAPTVSESPGQSRIIS